MALETLDLLAQGSHLRLRHEPEALDHAVDLALYVGDEGTGHAGDGPIRLGCGSGWSLACSGWPQVVTHSALACAAPTARLAVA